MPNYLKSVKGIDNPAKNFLSKRTLDGRMEVTKGEYICKKCRHDKAFKKHSGVFCTRCGTKIK